MDDDWADFDYEEYAAECEWQQVPPLSPADSAMLLAALLLRESLH
jgi:hypothetical protein